MQWTRVKAVAKDTMDRYDRYVSEMERKIRRQRAQIDKRANEILQKLAQEEERVCINSIVGYSNTNPEGTILS